MCGRWFRVPEGRHLVSLYFYNPNGREKLNGHRDFVVEARKILRSSVPPKILTRDIPIRELKLPPDCMIEELERQLASPVLARCRVKDFSGSGVYKTFLMNGGGCYGFRVVRNNSMNTILNGVFLTGLASSARKKQADAGSLWARPSAASVGCPLASERYSTGSAFSLVRLPELGPGREQVDLPVETLCVPCLYGVIALSGQTG